MKNIVVFAANECVKKREKYYYSLAYHTGKLLGKNGFVTVTGGGPGLMNEVCRGAYENGGKVIGICINIAGRTQSKYLTVKETYDTLNPRQDRLLSLADGYIALPGGIGTLYEIFAVLSLKRKGEIAVKKPMILLTDYYSYFKLIIRSMRKEGLVYKKIYELFDNALSPEEAIQKLKNPV